MEIQRNRAAGIVREQREKERETAGAIGPPRHTLIGRWPASRAGRAQRTRWEFSCLGRFREDDVTLSPSTSRVQAVQVPFRRLVHPTGTTACQLTQPRPIYLATRCISRATHPLCDDDYDCTRSSSQAATRALHVLQSTRSSSRFPQCRRPPLPQGPVFPFRSVSSGSTGPPGSMGCPDLGARSVVWKCPVGSRTSFPDPTKLHRLQVIGGGSLALLNRYAYTAS